MINPAAFIFDLDGVLIDSEPLHERAQRIVFAEYDLVVPEDAYPTFKGKTEEAVFDFIVDTYGDDRHQADFLIEQKHRVYEDLFGELQPVPGAVDFVRHLARLGYPLGLATSAIAANQQRAVRMLGLDNTFDTILTADDVTHAKPHPEPYTRSAAALGLTPSACLVIEDTDLGIQSATRAGCRVVGITTTFEAEKLSHAGANLVVDSFAELADRLGFD
jgi:HAD superfamily hydrolase (TIGR01509 family)